MRKLFAALLLCGAAPAFAQQPTELSAGGCGTVTPPAALQRVYDFVQHNPAAYAKGTGVQDTLPLAVHIVGTDAGSGYYPVPDLARVICQLNAKFAPVNFYFYVQWPIQYINSTDYYAHNYWTGEDMMQRNNVSGAVNVYFVQDPAGNCGYYTYSGDAVAIAKSCAGNNSTTLAHELGHFFGLPHTFSGWENGRTPANPENVRRSGPGTNCNSAGDGFCDTDADYVSVRWGCSYPTTKTDAYGDPYHLDSSMYMSYSSDACQSRFSAQQMAAMRDDLHAGFNRVAIHSAVPPPHTALSTPAILYPADTMYANANRIVWSKVAGADYYYVKITYLNSLPRETVFTQDTSLSPSYVPLDNVGYIVTVSPVSAFDLCMTHTVTHQYTYSSRNGALAVGQTPAGGVKGLEAYPNPLQGQELFLRYGGLAAGDYALRITDISGRTVHLQPMNIRNDAGTLRLAVPALPDGIYYLRCTGSNFQQTQKLVISR